MAQTAGNSTEFNERQSSAPEGGSEISDMASIHELGIEVASPSHEDNQDPPVLPECQPPSSQKPNFKSYEKEKTVEPWAPTEDDGHNDVIFSGKTPDYVRQKIAEAMSLLKMDLNRKVLGKRPNIHATKKTNKKHSTFEGAKDSQDQGYEMINVEVDPIDNETPHT
ncbi:hypothetical protein O181_092468 [Austropuccinia psidii MF-1]|uniref:Uncharacterized protein n=1 Tax=Austropuccinia psidii MF-1 TaxID=1389203 RepID=A0A9Q3P8F5_9BASI|nr:hypothetical protein [Austropuccinia psidii MF-1]